MEPSLDGFVGRIPSWSRPYYDNELTASVVDLPSSAEVRAAGRQACEDLGPCWQAPSEPFATPVNAIPKTVLSNSLHEGT